MAADDDLAPEVIEAGVDAILSEPGGVYGIGHFSVEDLAKHVFLAMDAKRKAPEEARGQSLYGADIGPAPAVKVGDRIRVNDQTMVVRGTKRRPHTTP